MVVFEFLCAEIQRRLKCCSVIPKIIVRAMDGFGMIPQLLRCTFRPSFDRIGSFQKIVLCRTVSTLAKGSADPAKVSTVPVLVSTPKKGRARKVLTLVEATDATSTLQKPNCSRRARTTYQSVMRIFRDKFQKLGRWDFAPQEDMDMHARLTHDKTRKRGSGSACQNRDCQGRGSRQGGTTPESFGCIGRSWRTRGRRHQESSQEGSGGRARTTHRRIHQRRT